MQQDHDFPAIGSQVSGRFDPLKFGQASFVRTPGETLVLAVQQPAMSYHGVPLDVPLAKPQHVAP